MANRFSKQKLAEALEKKAKGGFVSGLLSKKKTGDASNKRLYGNSSFGPFACQAPCLSNFITRATLKAHKVLSVEDLSPLIAKSCNEALGESLFVSGKLLDLEKKVAMSEPVINSLSAKNETLKNKVAILTVEVENDKERVVVLEKSLQVEKDVCKIKDKQIGDPELKLQKVEATVVKEFKDFDEYFDELYLSGLVMDEVKKELLADRPFEVIVENVTKEATYVTEVMEEVAITTLVDLVPYE
nr:hypothetical protein CFP56_37941 [Quercus suber]